MKTWVIFGQTYRIPEPPGVDIEQLGRNHRILETVAVDEVCESLARALDNDHPDRAPWAVEEVEDIFEDGPPIGPGGARRVIGHVLRITPASGS